MQLINNPFQKNTFRYAKVKNTTNLYKVGDTKYWSLNGENGLKKAITFRNQPVAFGRERDATGAAIKATIWGIVS